MQQPALVPCQTLGQIALASSVAAGSIGVTLPQAASDASPRRATPGTVVLRMPRASARGVPRAKAASRLGRGLASVGGLVGPVESPPPPELPAVPVSPAGRRRGEAA